MNDKEFSMNATVMFSIEGVRALGLASRKRIGVVVGHSRDKSCVWVIWNGARCRQSYHRDFLEAVELPMGQREGE